MLITMLYQNKYRIESARCPTWDYSSPGYYFITVLTHDRRHLFGEITNRKMHLNNFGKITNDEWRKTGEIRDGIVLDEYIVMPNHVHGIIRILPVKTTIPNNQRKNTIKNQSPDDYQNGHSINDVIVFPPTVETPCHGVSTTTGNNVNTNDTSTKWKSGVLGAIIGQFIIQVTKRIRKSGMNDFNWQPRFHDRIIRDAKELFRICQYIRNNPANWLVENEFDDSRSDSTMLQ